MRTCPGVRHSSDRDDVPLPFTAIPGSVISIQGAPHRILARIKKRVFASDLLTHHPYLVQDPDGSIQLPTLSSILVMIERGQAVPETELAEPSATARMKREIEMLEAARVPQGDKAIWIFLTVHWTAALKAQFGPHDEPWKIRRWRTALRRAAKRMPTS